MTWLGRLALVLVVVLAAATSFAHEEDTLDPHNATVGLRLELRQNPQRSPAPSPTYRLSASGFPADAVVSVWAQDFGQVFHRIVAEARIDEFLDVVSMKGTRLTLAPGVYPRGAAWQVAVVSQDGTLRAFTGVIPRPILAQDKQCTLQLELVSYRGTHFVATGAGFPPDDEVVALSRFSGRVVEKRLRISHDGRLPADVVAHDGDATDDRARYEVKGRSCEPAVSYHWGKSALTRAPR